MTQQNIPPVPDVLNRIVAALRAKPEYAPLYEAITERCTLCAGVGSLRGVDEDPEGGMAPCPDCNGTGRVLRDWSGQPDGAMECIKWYLPKKHTMAVEKLTVYAFECTIYCWGDSGSPHHNTVRSAVGQARSNTVNAAVIAALAVWLGVEGEAK